MRRGTTPTIQFECDADLSAYQRVVLTFRAGCGCESVDVEKERITFIEGGFSVTLTQEETLRLGGRGEVQVRAVDAEGMAVASEIASVDFDRILHDGILEVGDGAD